MKKLLIILFLLISINGISQTQKYWSYQKFYTEAAYTEKFDDTTKIVLEHTTDYKLLVISNNSVFEFFVIYDKIEYTGVLGLKSIYYNIIENKLPVKIEFLYSSGLLMQISITRKSNITTYIFQPTKDWL